MSSWGNLTEADVVALEQIVRPGDPSFYLRLVLEGNATHPWESGEYVPIDFAYPGCPASIDGAYMWYIIQVRKLRLPAGHARRWRSSMICQRLNKIDVADYEDPD